MTRFLFLAYLLLTTAVLLVPNPFRIAGAGEDLLREVHLLYVQPLAHFVLFAPLGFLALASRWRPGGVSCLALLAVFAVATEVAQYWVPRRTAEWSDLWQDLAGLAAGAAVWWCIRGRDPVKTPLGKSETARDGPPRVD